MKCPECGASMFRMLCNPGYEWNEWQVVCPRGHIVDPNVAPTRGGLEVVSKALADELAAELESELADRLGGHYYGAESSSALKRYRDATAMMSGGDASVQT